MSCGSSDKKQEISSFSVSYEETLNPYTSELSLSSDTPQGLGTLLSIHNGSYFSNKITMCTWFLIDEEHALTNSHCIPEKLKEDKSTDCAEYLQGAFSIGAGESVTRKCEKVISFSQIKENKTISNNDYALIKLKKKVDLHRYYGFSRSGVSEDETLITHVMNHNLIAGVINSDFEEKHCISKSSDLFGKILSSGASPLTLFGNCKTIEGNSGSPVLNQNGDTVGIVHGGIKEGFDFSESLNTKNLKSLVSSEISIVTNLRCFKIGISKYDSNIPNICSTENKKGISNKLESKMKEQLEGKLKSIYSDELPAFIEFDLKIKEIASVNYLNLSPKCIKQVKLWAEDDKMKITNKNIFKQMISVNVPTYTYSLNLTLDYYGNYDSNIIFDKENSITYEFIGLKKIKKNKKVKGTYTTKSFGKTYNWNLSIPMCEEQKE
jgi:hypothetical protein